MLVQPVAVVVHEGGVEQVCLAVARDLVLRTEAQPQCVQQCAHGDALQGTTPAHAHTWRKPAIHCGGSLSSQLRWVCHGVSSGATRTEPSSRQWASGTALGVLRCSHAVHDRKASTCVVDSRWSSSKNAVTSNADACCSSVERARHANARSRVRGSTCTVTRNQWQ